MANCTSFKADILPKFTPIDIQHMAAHGVYLSTYDWMKQPANAALVYSRLTDSGDPMPPPPEGPWQPAWIACFKTWMDSGYQP